MGFLAPLGALIPLIAGMEIGITSIFIGALISTAFSVLGMLIFQPKQDRSDAFQPTPFTRRDVGGSTPIVLGRRRTFGSEKYRKNDSETEGASSQQFFQITYSAGPVGFISDTKVFGERNIKDLGFGNIKSSILAYYLGTLDQPPTGFGWADIAGTRADANTVYDTTHGLTFTPDAPHLLNYVGRAYINAFLAADEQGRNSGMNVSVDSLVDGMLCRRFKDSEGDYLCHVGDHNKHIDFWYDDKIWLGEVAAGDYTALELAAAIHAALEDALDEGDNSHTIDFTCTYSTVTDLFTITSDTDGVTLLTWTGPNRGVDIWDEIGMLRGARYDFDPVNSGGNEFSDLQLELVSEVYTIDSFHTFPKSFTRNPIRICFEYRTNPHISPGVEHPDDFDQSLMFEEEKYCNEIVVVDETTQYDVQPRNVLPLLAKAYPNDFLIDGTVGNSETLNFLIDESYSDPAEPPVQTIAEVSAQFGAERKIDNPHLAGAISQIVIKTNNTSIEQSFKIQYVDWDATRDVDVSQFTRLAGTTWADDQFTDLPGGTITDSTDGTITINLSPEINFKALRFVDFTAASGNFILTEVQIKGSSLWGSPFVQENFKTFYYNTTIYAARGNNINKVFNGGSPQGVQITNAPASTTPGISGPIYQFTFPMIRRIGRIDVYTNVGESQSYKVFYKANPADSWTELLDRQDIQGNDIVFFEPVEMIEFALTDMSRGDGSNPFQITEVEAYDAVPSPRYTIDAVIESNQNYKDNLLRLYQGFFAIPVESVGKRWILVEKDEAPVQEINDDHLVSLSKKPATPRREKINQWNLKFPNELKEYEDDMIVVDDFADQLIERQYPGGGTGNIIQAREIAFDTVTRPLQMHRMGAVLRERANISDRVYSVKCLPGKVAARIGRVVRLHSPLNNVNKQLARIMKYKLNADHSVELECMRHVGSIYDDTAITPSDLNFYRDDAGSSSNTEPPADPTDIEGTVDTPSNNGIMQPAIGIQAKTPAGSNFFHYDVWVNENDEADSNGDRIWTLARSNYHGDGSKVIPIDTTNAVDGNYKAKYLLQAVGKNGARKTIRSIEDGYDSGLNQAVLPFFLPLDNSNEFYNAYSKNISIHAAQGSKKIPFLGSDLVSNQLTLSENYQSGTVELYVNHGYWTPKNTETISSDTWEFEEISDDTIELRYPIAGAVPCLIKYVSAS